MAGHMRVVSPTDRIEDRGLIEDRETKAEFSPKKSEDEAGQAAVAEAESPLKAKGRPWKRRGLFMLLPLVLIGSGYWYVVGGQVVSMDDAFVESDKVGISTDVAGIVRDIDVRENQRVEPGQVLYHLDDLPF